MGKSWQVIMKHLFSLIFDPDFLIGSIGTSMAIVFPMLENLTDIFKFLGAAGGLILLYLSIKHKMLEIKKLKITTNDRSTGISEPKS